MSQIDAHVVISILLMGSSRAASQLPLYPGVYSTRNTPLLHRGDLSSPRPAVVHNGLTRLPGKMGNAGALSLARLSCVPPVVAHVPKSSWAGLNFLYLYICRHLDRAAFTWFDRIYPDRGQTFTLNLWLSARLFSSFSSDNTYIYMYVHHGAGACRL